MTFKRFKQLWDALITDAPKPVNPKITQQGSSAHTLEALAKAGDGDHSDFDKIQHLLNEEHKAFPL